jgi:hypothetical protein
MFMMIPVSIENDTRTLDRRLTFRCRAEGFVIEMIMVLTVWVVIKHVELLGLEWDLSINEFDEIVLENFLQISPGKYNM